MRFDPTRQPARLRPGRPRTARRVLCARPRAPSPTARPRREPRWPGLVAHHRHRAPGRSRLVGETVLIADGAALLGLRRTDGIEKWRLPFADEDRFTAAGAYIVVERNRAGSFVASEPTESSRLEVFDTATGSARWQADGPLRAVVRSDAVYLTRNPGPATTAP